MFSRNIPLLASAPTRQLLQNHLQRTSIRTRNTWYRPVLAIQDTTSLYVVPRRDFSDRLLGHSPMAPKVASSDSAESRIPTQKDVSVAGGVWNPTSAKRDKLAELKVELTKDQDSLDDAATEEQKLDLYLADGIQWIVHTVDQTRLLASSTTTSLSDKENNTDDETFKNLPRDVDPTQWDADQGLVDVESWLREQEENILSTIPSGQLSQQQWETYLSEAMQKLDEVLATLPASRYLRHIRDFYEVPSDIGSDTFHQLQDQIIATEDQELVTASGSKAMARYRLQLTRATCEHLKESWDTLTTLSDEALDRLAVKTEGQDTTQDTANEEDGNDQHGKIESLPLAKLNKALRTTLMGNAFDRVDALWDLVDQDDDGLLEKTEMEQVATSAVTPVQWALLQLFEEALEAAPVRGALSQEQADDDKATKNAPPRRPGWRERRRESKAKKRLLKSFQQAVNKHFEDEVEMPHRLRCIYAWAEKAHQDNKIDSVLIEASGWSGRKRYVELQPKISLPEFREVQQVHFTHLDRIGREITKSFREDLWVEQGKGRERAELRRDCAIFLLVVSIVDYGIIIL